MTDDVVVTAGVVIPARELVWAFARSGGPGGQNVNKVSSKVELRWYPAQSAAFTAEQRAWVLPRLAGRLTGDGALLITSTLTRDQPKNRADALAKLAAIVVAALARPRPRRATKPSRAAKRRRVEAKRAHGERKRDRSTSHD